MALEPNNPQLNSSRISIRISPKVWPFLTTFAFSCAILVAVAWSLPDSEHKNIVFGILMLLIALSSWVQWKKSLKLHVTKGTLTFQSPLGIITPITNISHVAFDPKGTLYFSLYDPQLIYPPEKVGLIDQTMEEGGYHFAIQGISKPVALQICKACNLSPDYLIENELEPDEIRDIESFQSLLAQKQPWAPISYTLFAINILVFIAMLYAGVDLFQPTTEQLLAWGANAGTKTMDGEAWRLLSSAFLHIGLVHLGVNMFVLWKVGPFLERLFGSVTFLIFYFVSAIGGSEASLWWNEFGVSAGASGALFGIFGSLLGYLLVKPPGMSAAIMTQLRFWALNFIVLNIAFVFFLAGVDQAAHGGGALAGLLIGLLAGAMQKNSVLKTRILKHGILLLAGVGLCWASWVTLQKETADKFIAIKTFERFGKEEESLLEKFTNGQNQLRKTQLTEDGFATLLETEITPVWSNYATKFNGFKKVPNRWSGWYPDFVVYLNTQVMAQTLLMEGIKTKDKSKVEKAHEKFSEAGDLVMKITTEMKAKSKNKSE
jgi:membrane associated rhomboid family serine protease